MSLKYDEDGFDSPGDNAPLLAPSPDPSDPQPPTEENPETPVKENTAVKNVRAAAEAEEAIVHAYDMGWSSYIIPLFSAAGLMTTCFGLGRFGYSYVWIAIFVGVSLLKDKLWKQRQKRVIALQKSATAEREMVMAQLQDLPAWVQFPDTERVEWVNKVIDQLWPYIGEYTKTFLKEMVEPQVKASLPGAFKSFRFMTMDMGDIPLRVGGIKVYTENVGRDKIIMDMDVAYAGDCDFVVGVGAFRAGLNQMQFKGKLRAILKPLIAKPPMIGGVTAFFLDDPHIDFNLTGLGEMIELPGLMGAIRGVVTTQVRAICVLPNEIVVPLTAETDVAKLHFPEPDGVLRVNVVGARNLENRDISFIKKGKSDPYTAVSVGAQVYKTETIDNNLDPKWNECFEAVVDQASGQKLQIEVFDEDAGSNDEELGRLALEIADIREKGVSDTWYQLEGAKHGDIHLRLYWMELSSNPADLKREDWEKEWLESKHPLHPALLMVYIDCISDLPYPKHNIEPSPLVEVSLGQEMKKTYPKPKTVNPLYQQKFIFWVTDPENQSAKIEARDEPSGRSLGELSIPLKKLLTEPNMEAFQQTYPLVLGAMSSTLVMTLRLRTMHTRRKSDEVKPLKMRAGSGRKGGEPEHIAKTVRGAKSRSNRKADSSLDSNPSDPLPTLNGGGYDGGHSGDSLPRSVGGQRSKRSSSIMSKMGGKKHRRRRDSTATTDQDHYGRIQLTIRYSFQMNHLMVTVNQLENLYPLADEGSADPYVKVKLLFEGSVKEKFKTGIAPDTLNPVFDKTFEFEFHHNALKQYSLRISVKDGGNYGFFHKAPLMGQVNYDLKDFDKEETLVQWFDLKPKPK